MKRLSVIIPSYNSARTIEATLTGILSQSGKDIISEVIVVDSSDDKTTKEIISRYTSDRVRLITPGIRLMPAIVRNVGAKYATGNVLAFIDSDAWPDPDWAKKILETWHNGCLAGGGSISLPEFQKKKLIPVAQYYLQFNEYMGWGRPRVKEFLPSCSLFCSRELFEKVGGFPLLRTAEDVMFGLNVSKHAAMWFIPEAKVYHIFREDLKAFLKNQLILGKGNIRYRRLAYPHTFYYKGIWPLIFLPGFMTIKLTRIIIRVVKTRPHSAIQLLAVLPALLLGLLFMGIGFAEGAIEDGNH